MWITTCPESTGSQSETATGVAHTLSDQTAGLMLCDRTRAARCMNGVTSQRSSSVTGVGEQLSCWRGCGSRRAVGVMWRNRRSCAVLMLERADGEHAGA
jgi:hypothetical protein